ncbi:MAG: universal stress protein [bacterium]
MRAIINVINKNQPSSINNITNCIAKTMSFNIIDIMFDQLVDIIEIIDENDAALIVCEIDKREDTQKYLNLLRDIRVPYIFTKPSQTFELKHIALPITFLIEEKEKAPFASSFARSFNADITIYQPKDYGTKAQQNIDAISTLFNSLNVDYKISKGSKGSDKIEFEALKLSQTDHQLIIISASREYGLDDIILGPKERKIINQATIPVMVINPRGDLYALCD